MAQNKKEQKKRYGISSRPILSLLVGLGFLSIILLAAIMTSAKGTGYPKNQNSDSSQQGGEESLPGAQGNSILAVVKAIDSDNKTITLFNIERRDLVELKYNGGTNITDKYGKAIAISQIDIGEMVDATYPRGKDKLTDMSVSKKAWTYANVNNLGINLEKQTMKIAKNLYKYENDILILDGKDFITAENLAEQDELLVRGYEETIWSITVTKGHGVVILQDYEDFLGDYITIGYEAIQQIAENMEIVVREGNFNLTVENGDYTATKNITVNRNQETYVSLSDLGPGGSRLGRITFHITPFGADLHVDGQLLSYANPIEMAYGEHNLKVSMGGYTSYVGTLTVDSSGKTVKIDLPESSSKQEATVSETDDSTTADHSTDDSTGDSSGNPSGTTGGSSGTSSGGSTGTGSSGSGATGTPSKNSDIDEKHQIYVQNPTGASVYIDGDYKCTSPGNFPKIIGTHVITFIKDGYKTMSYTVEVSDDGLDSYYTFPDLSRE